MINTIFETGSFEQLPYFSYSDGFHFMSVLIQDVISNHNHRFLELGYVKTGAVIHELNGVKQILPQGRYIIIDYSDEHEFTLLNGNPAVVQNCLFKPEFIDKGLVGCNSFKNVLKNYLIDFDFHDNINPAEDYVFHDDDGVVVELMSKIEREFMSANYGSVALIRAYLIEILILTMRKLQQRKLLEFNKSISKEVAQIMEYVSKNYSKRTSLSDISKKYNISLGHLSRKFKVEAGCGFIEYLQSARVDAACHLIAQTDKKIEEIGEDVGYDDIKFFSKIFKKSMNMTPKAYKKYVTNAKNRNEKWMKQIDMHYDEK